MEESSQGEKPANFVYLRNIQIHAVYQISNKTALFIPNVTDSNVL